MIGKSYSVSSTHHNYNELHNLEYNRGNICLLAR